MSKLIIKHYLPEYAPQMVAIQQKYARLHRSVEIVGEDVFNFPEFDQGKNILCAFDESDCLVGYTDLFPKPVSAESAPALPHRIWFELKADIDHPHAAMVRNQLFTALFQRAGEIAAGLPDRPVLLCVSKYSDETEDLSTLAKQGFEPYESLYTMKRDLQYPTSDVPLPEGITVRQSKLATEEEQRQYIQSNTIAFPHAPMSLEWLRYFLQSPHWSVGTAFNAYAPDGTIAGSVMAYWDPHDDRAIGITEDIFVLPAWQGKGVGKYIVKEALEYLQAHGLSEARLTVTAQNDKALTVYMTLGYELVNHQLLLSRGVR